MFLAAGIGILVVVVSFGSASRSSGPAAGNAGAVPVYHLDTDHATYPAVPQVSNAAPVILTGEVVSHSFEPGESPGVDAQGDPVPAIPHTNYSISVLTVLKGNPSPGDIIVVSLSGGISKEGRFILDGAPEIHDGDISMYFLERVGGLYYPLAGGAAVAVETGSGEFSLPTDATGEAPLGLTEETVSDAINPPSPADSPGPSETPASSSPSSASSNPSVPPAPVHRAVKRCRPSKKKKVKRKVRCVHGKKHAGRKHHSR